MNKISFIPLGGSTDITKNMYLYEYQDFILIVDCGLGFANETMIGVDLILPDISYLLKSNKKIAGLVLTHGHEDHIGALPYILPQLSGNFEMYATPFTAELINQKLKEFGIGKQVKTAAFTKDYNLGPFNISFIKITHSVPDTSNIFIKTPAGNFYHGSDFKFDDAPFDGKLTDYSKIESLSKQGVLCLMSDVLGAEKPGRTPSESILTQLIEDEMRNTKGKLFFTTYSSNINRQNQVVVAAKKSGRKVCFVGRSLLNASSVGKKLGYLNIDRDLEVDIKEIKKVPDNKLVLIVAGAQAQEGSALSRIVAGEVAEVSISKDDTVIFSSDPIPGNEVSVYELVDEIAKIGAKVFYADNTPKFHTSGHGSSEELMKMVDLVRPKKVLPIGGTFRHMAAYKNLVKKKGFSDSDIILLDDGQEVIFGGGQSRLGRKIDISNVFVDQLSGEEVESFVLRDREKISKDGVVIVLVEINSSNGTVIESNVVSRGFLPKESQRISKGLDTVIKSELSKTKVGIRDWNHVRKNVGNISERFIFKRFRRRPLVLPIVIEV